MGLSIQSEVTEIHPRLSPFTIKQFIGVEKRARSASNYVSVTREAESPRYASPASRRFRGTRHNIAAALYLCVMCRYEPRSQVDDLGHPQ